MSKGQGKLLKTTNQGNLCFVRSLPLLLIEIHGSKLSFYRNIFYENVSCNVGLNQPGYRINIFLLSELK